MSIPELSVELEDRLLRFDGVSILAPTQVLTALSAGVQPSQLRVSSITPEIEQFNQQVDEPEQLRPSTAEPVKIDLDWRLPAHFTTLNLREHIIEAFTTSLPRLSYTEAELLAAAARLDEELSEIEQRGMTDFFRTICYILSVFRERSVVWGVGRGSSCASYILFILGLHLVDCVRLNVSASEFFHD